MASLFYWVDFRENRTPKGLHVEKQSGGLFFRAKKDCGYRKHEAKRSAFGTRNLSVKPDGLTQTVEEPDFASSKNWVLLHIYGIYEKNE